MGRLGKTGFMSNLRALHGCEPDMRIGAAPGHLRKPQTPLNRNVDRGAYNSHRTRVKLALNSHSTPII